jgi:signal transduction histidine kinase/ActR/RegA family two-component response regulator
MFTGAEPSLAIGLPSNELALLLVAFLLASALLVVLRRLVRLRGAHDRLIETRKALELVEPVALQLEDPVALLDDRDGVAFENVAFGLAFPPNGGTSALPDRLGLDDQQRDALTQGLAAIRSGGDARFPCFRRVSCDREPQVFGIVGKRVDASQSPRSVLLQFRDRTEETQLVQALLRARRFDRTGKQLSSWNHDLNNRLSVIRSATELISLELPEAHPSQSDLRTIRDVLAETTRLISEFATNGRSSPTDRSPSALTDLLRGLEPSLRRLAGRRVEVILDLGLVPLQVTLSPSAIEEVVLQLAANAIEATSPGGKVRIAVSNASEATVLLTVEDHGPGIDAPLRDHLFEPFRTNKEPATHPGLGLATVQALVEHVGGRITYDSDPHGGAIFRIQLPKAKEQRMTASLPPVQTNGAPLSLLVLDDEEPVRRLLVRLLLREGYTVADAATLDEAIERAKGMERLDVWVTDANVDGKDATFSVAKIRAFHPTVAVVLVSGREPDADRMEELSQQGVRFLQKPFTPAELREAIDTALRHGSATSAVVPLASEALAHTDRRAP